MKERLRQHCRVWVRVFLVALLSLGAVPLRAAEVDVSGSWQVNVDCGFVATATAFFDIAEDPTTGVLTASSPADCGTLQVPGAIVKLPAACGIASHAWEGRVSAGNLDLPASGSGVSDIRFETPFRFDMIECTVARIVSAEQFTGRVTDDGSGWATRIDGTLSTSKIDFRTASGRRCLFIAGGPVCRFSMRRNEVPAGSDVTVSPREGATVTFARVIEPGTVAVTPLTEVDGVVPATFRILGDQGVPIFYDVRTTATVAGAITSCFSYPDSDGDGVVDGTDPPFDEQQLRILHEEDGVFVDRTVSLDPDANVICAETTSLSPIVIGTSAVESLCEGRSLRLGPACAGQSLPRRLARRLARGCALLEKASAASGAKKALTLVRRAKRKWRKAQKQLSRRRTRRALSARCVKSLLATIASARAQVGR